MFETSSDGAGKGNLQEVCGAPAQPILKLWLWWTTSLKTHQHKERDLAPQAIKQTQQLGSWKLIAFTASKPRGISDAHHWQQHLQDNDFRLLWESWAADLATLKHVTLFQCDSAGNAVEIIFLKFRSTLPLHLGTTRTGSGYKAGLLHLMAGVRVSLQVFVVNSLSYGWAGQLEPVDEHHEEVQVHCGSRETHEHWKVTGIRAIWEAAHKFWVHWRCLIVSVHEPLPSRTKKTREKRRTCRMPNSWMGKAQSWCAVSQWSLD